MGEDHHFVVANLGEAGWERCAAFGVMDGHGGAQVAQFCEQHLPAEIARGPSHNAKAALIDAFHRMDEMLAQSWYIDAEHTGCTAVVCCVRDDSIVVANAGDSRAVLCRNGRAIPLSYDHKPHLPEEQDRIANAGGYIVEYVSGPHTVMRVCGGLNLTRAIGDLAYKHNTHLSHSEQIISSTPDVREFTRQRYDEFMILACDGIWDVLTDHEAVRFVRERLRMGRDIS